AVVQTQLDEGGHYGVDGTPGFFVNGRLLSGAVPLSTFTQIGEEELATPQGARQGGREEREAARLRVPSAPNSAPGPLEHRQPWRWRVVREGDLSALRTAAHARFTLSLVSETGEDASRLQSLISSGLSAPHPWIETAAATTQALSLLSSTPVAGLIVTRAARL